ncbi:molecular chaperone DnaJ, partial [Leptospira interrogans serovar Pomona]|nr:molecular chaperone DnaJ [Leptospira interrogans serovar Pomona]
MAVNTKPDYYKLLNVPRSSNLATIESAYWNYLEKLDLDPWNPS